MFQIIAMHTSLISLIFVSEYLNLTFFFIPQSQSPSNLSYVLERLPSWLGPTRVFPALTLSCLPLSLFPAAFRGLV